MFKIISLISQKYLFKFFGKKSKIKFDQIYNIEKGKSCYIFGDGVSLKYLDLKNFKDLDIIAGNNFIIHNDFKSLPVKYYVFYQPFWFFPLIKVYNKISLNYMYLTIMNLMSKANNTLFFSSVTNILLFKVKSMIFLKENSFDNTRLNELTGKFNCFEGTLRLQILIAIYLGYDEVTLIGHDYTHSPAQSGHFYEFGKGIHTNHDYWNQEFLEEAKKHLKIKTLTINSVSNRLDFIKYSKINYKENIQIVSKKYLDKMSKFFYYKVYK